MMGSEVIRTGKVYLIGAGPGDWRLITLRGWQILQRADIVLYDGLVNEELLDFAPANCQKQCVGKRGHGGTWQQSQINDLIVESARHARIVVRLKGGDTGVFARTAEEVERLEAEGIPYEIIPGITAALAVSAYTGIPITHRDWSSSVALVTGQGQAADGYPDAEEPMDWDSLARFPGTLILYMGLSTASQWSRSLIAAGKPANTPVALIRKCSWPDQQVVQCELGTLEETLELHRNLTPPILSIIGEVVQARPSRSWFSSQPLHGKKFLVTSPGEQGKALKNLLEDQGAECLLAPVVEIVPPESWKSLDQAIDQLASTDWIAFSSVHGVHHFFQRLEERRLDARALARAKVAAVGSATAESMKTYGIRCDLVPSQGTGAEALWQDWHSQVEQKRITVVRASEGKTWLLERLRETAAFVCECEAYRQHKITSLPAHVQSRMQRDGNWIGIATSSNLAEHAAHLIGPAAVEVTWLSLSDSVTATLKQIGCQHVVTSAVASYPGLIETALQAFGSPPSVKD